MQRNANAACGVAAELKALANLIKRCVNAAWDPEDVGLTGSQCYILGYLTQNRNRDIYQKDVEAEFRIRRSTATRLLQALEKNAFITRASEERDGRLKRLALTPKAVELSAAMEGRMRVLEGELLRGVSPEEQEQFRRVLGKIRLNAERIGGEAHDCHIGEERKGI